MESIILAKETTGLKGSSTAVQTVRPASLAGLPEELLDGIIERLHRGSQPLSSRTGPNFKQSCSALSLTCKALRGPCQRALLSHIRVETKHSQAFADCAKGSKSLYDYVHDLTLVGNSNSASDYIPLCFISFNWEKLAVVTFVDLGRKSTESMDTTGQDCFQQLLNHLGMKTFTFNNFVVRNARILPTQPLESITLHFDVQKEEKAIHHDYLSSSLMSVSAKEITIRDLVCYQDSDKAVRSTLWRDGWSLDRIVEKEEELLSELSAVLGKPVRYNLERSRMHPRHFASLFDNTLGQGLSVLTLNQLVRMKDGRTYYQLAFHPYSLEGLVNLRHLRLGAIDQGLVTGFPAALESVTILVVNAFGSTAWLESVLDPSAGCGGLPISCTISVIADTILPKLDGPSDVQDPRTAVGQAQILEHAEEMDRVVARSGRALVTGSFQDKAVGALGRYFPAMQEEGTQLERLWAAETERGRIE